MEGWMDGGMDGWMDRWMERWVGMNLRRSTSGSHPNQHPANQHWALSLMALSADVDASDSKFRDEAAANNSHI